MIIEFFELKRVRQTTTNGRFEYRKKNDARIGSVAFQKNEQDKEYIKKKKKKKKKKFKSLPSIHKKVFHIATNTRSIIKRGKPEKWRAQVLFCLFLGHQQEGEPFLPFF